MIHRVKAQKAIQKRDALKTQEKLLEAAIEEFSEHGFEGARVARIVKKAGFNIRMAYHYFHNKQGLYQAALESVYASLRSAEHSLLLTHLQPLEAIEKLTVFTFDYMAEHPEFMALVLNENKRGGLTLKSSQTALEGVLPFMQMIEDLLRQGSELGVTRVGLKAKDVYLTILSLSVTHITQRHTLSLLFQEDLSAKNWLESRKEVVVDVVMSYVSSDIN